MRLWGKEREPAGPKASEECSFCDRESQADRLVIQGPGSNRICADCVQLVDKLLKDQPRLPSPLGLGMPEVPIMGCNFCGRHLAREQLIAQAGRPLAICGDCVALCQDILEDEKKKAARSR